MGLDNGTMLPENAALVGAGVLSVLLFPLVTVLLDRPVEPQPEAEGTTLDNA